MKKIAIIGGGLTGLTAAYRLSNQGYDVTIYEKSDYIGGLASGFEIQGTNIEKTYHHIFRTDMDIRNLVHELDLDNKLLWLKSSMSIYYNGKLYAYGTPISLIKFKPLSFIDRVRHGIMLLYLAKTKNWKQFTNVSAYEWLKKWSGKNNMKIFFDPLLRGKFSEYYDKVSMAWMWARVHVRGNSQEKGGEKLGYFDDGFNVIIQALKKKLEQNQVKIVLGANVELIKDEILNINNYEEEKVIVNVDGREEKFDKVIATIPSHVFAKLVEKSGVEDTTPPAAPLLIKEGNFSEYLKKLKSIDYLGAVVAVFTSSQKLSEYYWNNISDLSMPFLAFINHTNLMDKAKYNGKYVYYIGTYVPHDHKYFSQADDEIWRSWFDAVTKMFPDFDETKVDDKHLFKFKYAQHVVDLNYADKIPDYQTPIKNVYLANFSQIFPEDRGTNYAVREGNKIAELVQKS